MSLEVYITEFDVDMTNVKGTKQQKLILQAEIYKDMLSTCLESKNCAAFVSMVFSNLVSIYRKNSSPEALSASPLPFDSDFNPKPAYYAMLQAIYSSIQQ